MQQFLITFSVSLVSMLAMDAIWLSTMAKFYRAQIGHLMLENMKMGPAVLFYTLYAFAVSFIVILPGVNSGHSIWRIGLTGALFGLTAYAAYDLTNQATLRSWPILMTVVDMAWGAILTGTVCVVTVAFFKYFG